MTPNAPPSALPAHLVSSPPGSSRQNWADTVGTVSSVNSYASASSSRNVPSTPSQLQHLPGVQDIYTTESVRQLRDVELAIDPAFYGQGTVNGRRLSTHPRMSERENPFHSIHALISRRGIRPFVLELVQALGAFIDAVWSVCHPGKACPWAGVPTISRRPSFAGALQQSKTWCSWTLAAVQEGKRQGFLNSPPTEKDVTFWNREVRYGLRDIDEAVNRRKDLGWAFGKTVIEGQYGDITASNVFAHDGVSAGNIARLLNDLEEVSRSRRHRTLRMSTTPTLIPSPYIGRATSLLVWKSHASPNCAKQSYEESLETSCRHRPYRQRPQCLRCLRERERARGPLVAQAFRRRQCKKLVLRDRHEVPCPVLAATACQT